MRLALEILTLVAGGIAMLSLLPRRPERRRARARRSGPRPPEDLERLERLMVSGLSSAGEVHLRLRPVLAEIASARLRRQGLRLDQNAPDARAVLGDDLWELVRPDRPKPDDPRGPGISLERLSEMVDRLEQR